MIQLLFIVLWMLRFRSSLPFVFPARRHGQIYPRMTCRRMATEDSLKTITSGLHSAEMDVKKSRFIGYAANADSWIKAQAYIDKIKAEHPKARHWCYAFCGGRNPVTERSTDDGEPAGTAGAPILNAIHGEGLSDTICVVVRYFGGIKLGAGGLVRAYGGAARLILRQAPVTVSVPQSSLRVRMQAAHIGTLYDTVASVKGTCSNEHYDAEGSVSITITCETACVSRLKERLSDASRGSASFLQAT